MRPICGFIPALLLILSTGYAHAQGVYDYKGIGTYDFYTTKPVTGAPSGNPGMQSIKVGGMDLMVPQGMKVYKMDGQVITEGLDSYTARRFNELEARLDKLTEALIELKKEMDESIDRLKKEVGKLKDMSQKGNDK